MSGIDERRKSTQEGGVGERANRLICLHCGACSWVKWHNYSSRILYNSESDRVALSNVEYTDTTDWECCDCGWPPNREQQNELDELELD